MQQNCLEQSVVKEKLILLTIEEVSHLYTPTVNTALCEHAERCITDVVGRWTHTFSRCPVSVAACHSEAEISPINIRRTQRLQSGGETHCNTNPQMRWFFYRLVG